MTRPPKPCRPGDHIDVAIYAWHRHGRRNRWEPTGHTLRTTAGDVRWDSWLMGGCWAVDLPPNPHHGRAAAEQIHVITEHDGEQLGLWEAA